MHYALSIKTLQAGTESGYAFTCTHGGGATGTDPVTPTGTHQLTTGAKETPSAQGERELHSGMSVNGPFRHSGS